MDPQVPGRHMFPRPQADEKTKSPIANWAVIGIFIILSFQMLAMARSFLMPVCLGVLLFFVFVPFRRWMDRRGMPAGVTAGTVVLGIVAALAVLGYFLSGPAGQLIDDAPEISRKLKEKYQDFRENFSGIEQAAEGLEGLTGSATTTATVTPGAQGGGASTATATVEAPASVVPGTADQAETSSAPLSDPTAAPAAGEAASGGIVTASSTVSQPQDGAPPATNELTVQVTAPSSTGGMAESLATLGPAFVSQLFFTLIFLFFLLASGDLLYLRIVQSFDSLKEKRTAYEALREIEDSLGNYLGSITIINVGLGVVSGLAMWALGMPSPLLWGVAAALLNYIPYIGAALGYIGAFVVALVVFDDIWWAIVVGATYFSLTAIEGQFVTPYFVSRRLQLNTVVVFLTVALWAWLWSIIGMVVAVPMLVVIRVLADHIPGLEKFGNFLAGETPPGISDDDDDDDEDEAGKKQTDGPAVGAAT